MSEAKQYVLCQADQTCGVVARSPPGSRSSCPPTLLSGWPSSMIHPLDYILGQNSPPASPRRSVQSGSSISTARAVQVSRAGDVTLLCMCHVERDRIFSGTAGCQLQALEQGTYTMAAHQVQLAYLRCKALIAERPCLACRLRM